MTFDPLPDPIANAFARQAGACRDLGSPFVAAICALVAEHGLPDSEARRRIATWPGAADAGGDAVPLRFAGALHRLVLDQTDDGFAAVFPPAEANNEALLGAIGQAVATHDSFIATYLDLPPQTNEVARSAVLLPVLLTLSVQHQLPMRLLEIGASAGLNQNLDRFRYNYGDWQWGDPSSPLHIACEWRGGRPHSEPIDLYIAERRCCDIAPVPIVTQDDRRRLQSYIWPDQAHRLQRLQAALTLADEHPPQIDNSGAADWLQTQLAPASEQRHTVLFHTIMWQYLPDAERARAENTTRRAGGAASATRPLSWLRFEADRAAPGAGIYLTTWNGSPDDGITQLLGRGDFHGRWIQMLE